MTIVKGVVNNKANKFDKHAIVVDGGTGLGELWYSSKFEINCNIGDLVEFDAGPEGKKWCSKLKVLSSGNPVKDKDGNTHAAPAPGQSVSGGGGTRDSASGGKKFLEPKMHSQRSIIRQNAVTNANAFITATGIKVSTVADLILLAKEIEEYTAGDTEAKHVKAKMAEKANAVAAAQEQARIEAAERAAAEPTPQAEASAEDDPFDALFD